MLEDFVARATELGSHVHTVSGTDEAVAEVSEIFRDSAALRVVLAPDLGDIAGPLAETLARSGADLLSGETAEALAVADLGVTRSPLGMAETGSIMVAGDDYLPRLASMLPLVHVAILDEGDLVASLDEAGEYLRRVSSTRGAGQIRYASIVSGPSRTSDVEKTLSVGVHGPGQLHIILVR